MAKERLKAPISGDALLRLSREGPGAFPRGPQAFQERYLAAFEGLTQVLGENPQLASFWSWGTEKWLEMFNRLIGEEEDAVD